MRATPEPVTEIDLAGEENFSLGALTLHPSAREVTWARGATIIEPRVMQVLVRLTRARGAVVSRDELIASCWGGRIVGDDAINRCVAKVRQIADLGGGPHFAVETVPRVGYRLRGEPGVQSNGTNGHSIAIPPPSHHRRYWIGAAALLIAAATGAGLWSAQSNRHWTVTESRNFLQSPPIIRHASFSPDGKMLAYSLGDDVLSRQIYIRNIAGGDAIQLTNDAFDHASPSWSSDGGRIAYVAIRKGEPCHIMVIAVPVGTPREIGRCHVEGWQTLSWRPNSNDIYYSDWPATGKPVQAIFKVDIETGRSVRITQGGGDYDPRVSPDGKWLGYVRLANNTRMELHILNLASGADRVLAADRDITSDAWTSDSSAVLAPFANFRGSRIRAYPIDGSPSYFVYSSPTIIYRLAPSSTGLLAAAVENSQIKLARMTAKPQTTPDIVDSTGGRTWSPTYAPDGTLAFASNRSGSVGIWIQKPGAKPVQLITSPYLAQLNWSPDGRYLAFFETSDTNAGAVKVITASGTTVSTISTNDPGSGFPTWTPDSAAILLSDKGQVWSVDIHNPARRTRIAGGEWIAVTVRPNGIFAARVDQNGVWRIDGQPKLINAHYPMDRGVPIAFLGNDILVPLDTLSAVQSRVLAQPVDGGPARMLGYLPAEEDGPIIVNPQTGEILYMACAVRGTDIDLLTLARL